MSSNYIPTQEDVQWLARLFEMIKVGGTWTLPTFGVLFRKTDKNTLRLLVRDRGLTFVPSYVTEAEIDEVLRRTVEVAKISGIKVILE